MTSEPQPWWRRLLAPIARFLDGALPQPKEQRGSDDPEGDLLKFKISMLEKKGRGGYR